MNSKLSFPFVIQRIASLTNIWLRSTVLTHTTDKLKWFHCTRALCRAFLLSAFQSVLLQLRLCAKPAHLPIPQTSSIIQRSHAIFSLSSGRWETSVWSISRKNPYDTVPQTHTSVNKNFILPTAHIHNKTWDFHSYRKLKHVTPNSEFSCRVREHENNKKLNNSTLENISWN